MTVFYNQANVARFDGTARALTEDEMRLAAPQFLRSTRMSRGHRGSPRSQQLMFFVVFRPKGFSPSAANRLSPDCPIAAISRSI
jgi:hypothetical protein